MLTYRAILNKLKGKIIEEKQLKYIVGAYIEDPTIKFEDLNKEEFKESTGLKSSGIDSCSVC